MVLVWLTVIVYKSIGDLNIGTAKPSQAEFSKCPHYLFNFVEMDRGFTAGEYHRKALELIESKTTRTAFNFCRR